MIPRPSMPLPVASVCLWAVDRVLSLSPTLGTRMNISTALCPAQNSKVGNRLGRLEADREPRSPHCPFVLSASRGPAPHCKARPTRPQETPARGFPGQPRPPPLLSRLPQPQCHPRRGLATPPPSITAHDSDPEGRSRQNTSSRGEGAGSRGQPWPRVGCSEGILLPRASRRSRRRPAGPRRRPAALGGACCSPGTPHTPGAGAQVGTPRVGAGAQPFPAAGGSRLCLASALARAPRSLRRGAARPGASKAPRIRVRDSATAESLNPLLASHPDPLNP